MNCGDDVRNFEEILGQTSEGGRRHFVSLSISIFLHRSMQILRLAARPLSSVVPNCPKQA